MEHVDIRDDTGSSCLRLLHRKPQDTDVPMTGVRLHVQDSDLVAGIDIEMIGDVAFLSFFSVDTAPPYQRSWTSPDGDWELQIDCNEDGKRVITSCVKSQLLYHPWFVRTSLEVSHDTFCETCDSLRDFVGRIG